MEIFLIGTLWFWLLFIVGFIVVTFCIEKEESSGWGAFLTCVAFLALLFFFGSKEPILGVLQYIAQNPLSVILMAGLYFFCGAVWSLVKWYLFLKDKRRKGLDQHHRYNKGAATEWKPDIPKAREYMGTILMWMSWWPFSALWTLVDDPIRRAFRNIFDHLEKTYDRMAERIMKAD